MESLYSGMSVGFGFLLICTILAFIWIVFKSFKKRMFPQNKSNDVIDLADYIAKEERKEQRTDIAWPVSIETDNGSIKTETKEVSRSGAFVKCGKPLLPGEKFCIIIETPSRGSISLKSEVVWSNANLPEDKVVSRGMGIRFIKNNDEDITLLKSALEEYLESINRTPDQRNAFI